MELELNPIFTAACSAGSKLAVGTSLGSVLLFDLEAYREVGSFRAHPKEITAMIYSDGEVVTADARGAVRNLTQLPTAVRTLARLPNGRLLASAGGEIFDLRSGRAVAAHAREVLAMAVSPDGTRLAGASGDGIVCVWDTATWTKLTQLSTRMFLFGCLAFRSNERLLLAFGQTIQEFDLARSQNVRTYPPLSSPVTAMTVDGEKIVVGLGRGAVQLLGSPEVPLESGAVVHVAFWSGGAAAVTAEGDVAWIRGDKEIARLGRHKREGIDVLDWSGDLLLTGDDGTVRAWDVTRGVQLQVREEQGRIANVVSAAIGPGPRIALARYASRGVHLYGAGRDEGIQAPAFVNRVRLSAETLGILTCNYDALLLDLRTHQVRKLPVRCWMIEFTPSGRATTVTADNRLLIWEPNGDIGFRYDGIESIVRIGFSENERFLGVVDFAGNCKAIDLATGKARGWAECPEQGCFAVSDDGALIAVGLESEAHLWYEGQKICALPLPGKAHAMRIRGGRLECLCLASEMSLLDASYKRTWIVAVTEIDARYESLFAYRLGASPKS